VPDAVASPAAWAAEEGMLVGILLRAAAGRHCNSPPAENAGKTHCGHGPQFRRAIPITWLFEDNR
jgi:hypothetical protein